MSYDRLNLPDGILLTAAHIKHIEDGIEEANKQGGSEQSNPLLGKKVSFLGDSICAGADTPTSYLGGYGRIIAERNNMTYQNLGQGGATVTAETYGSESGLAKGWLCRKVAEMDADADYAIIEGGLNDAWQYFDHGTITIGAITKGFNATLDDTTYYGAFESMLKQLVTRFQGKKIGYIAIPKSGGLYDSSQDAPNFYHIALECCAKWGVPVCDLNTIVPPFTYLGKLGTTYTNDGAHPNYEGYVKYYCDPIEAWMKTLTTGASVGWASSTVSGDVALKQDVILKKDVQTKKVQLTLEDGSVILVDVLLASSGSVVTPPNEPEPDATNAISTSIDTDLSIYGADYNGDGKNDGYLKNKRLSSSGSVKGEDEYTKSSVTGFMEAKSGDVVGVFGCKWGTTKHALNYICAYDSNFNFIGGHSTTTGTASLTLSTNTAPVATLVDVDGNLNTTFKIVDNPSIAYIRVSSCGENQGDGIDFANAIITIEESK